MILSIYKPGQGYWTRMMSAIGAGVLVLAGIFWLIPQLQVIGTDTALIFTDAQLTTGVIQWGKAANDPAKNAIGIVGASVNPNGQIALEDKSGTILLNPAQFAVALIDTQVLDAKDQAGFTPVTLGGTDIASVKSGDNKVTIRVVSWAARNLVYLQSGVGVVILVGMSAFLYWILNKPNVVDFMVATEAEMRKVSWPTRRELMLSTWVVICGTMMLAMLLFGIDLFFVFFFKGIGVLESGGGF